jgi:hypothetical protein
MKEEGEKCVVSMISVLLFSDSSSWQTKCYDKLFKPKFISSDSIGTRCTGKEKERLRKDNFFVKKVLKIAKTTMQFTSDVAKTSTQFNYKVNINLSVY